ncbi:hypothetical protein [Roseateles sp.]|uniref:hypothetical protein n=1 Tax=Roseateles sp. TaxID=1971397 RepID=UPI00286C6ACC|nr:hypothetical protein [Roseateles sp.]
MRNQTFVQIVLAAASFAGATAQAAEPQQQLDRVVITGKAVRTEIVQLPRVVVTGLSVNSQRQQLMLASAKPAVRRL